MKYRIFIAVTFLITFILNLSSYSMDTIGQRPAEGKDIVSYSIFIKDAGERKKESDARSRPEYTAYYKLIREKIEQKLLAKYIKYYNEGDIYITFSLKSDGSLVSLGIEMENSADNKELQDIAAISVKEASPFPPFPKALDFPKMAFNLLISFRK